MRRLLTRVLSAVMALCVVTVLHAKEESATVTRVVDGDTLLVNIAGTEGDARVSVVITERE